MSASHEVVLRTEGDRSWSLRLETFPVPRWFTQQNSWVQDPQNSDSAVYNYPLRLRIRGPLDPEALKKSLDELIRRHASLRSIFRVRGQFLTQIVLPERTCPLETIELNLGDERKRDSQAREVASQKARLPFDLSNDSPFRATLLRLGPEAHDLIIVAHHLVYDDWSSAVLTDELSATYKAMVDGKPSPLRELPFQYGDFVRWSQRRFGDKEIEAHILFWQEQLRGRARFHHFGPDHTPSGQVVRRAGREKLQIEESLVQALRVQTQRQRASLFMALMAGFQLLLNRYSREDDIAVGSCVANRMRVELEGLIGRFGNHVVVRTNFAGNPTFREALQRVREASLRAYSYQEVPFGTVLDAIRPPSQTRCDRLLQAMFVFQNAPKSAWQIPGVDVRWAQVEMDTTKYDLTVWLREGDGVEVKLEYNADLFEAETIDELLSQYHRLLSMMADNPEAHVDEFHVTPRMPLPEPAPAPVHPAPASGNGRWKWRFERKPFPRTTNGRQLRVRMRSAPQGPDAKQNDIGATPRQNTATIPHSVRRAGDTETAARSADLSGDEIEHSITTLWEDLLGIRPIRRDQNLFELGGDSLSAAKMAAQIESIFDVRVPLSALLLSPTIQALAQIVHERGAFSSWRCLVPIQPNGTRPRLFLFHGAGGNLLMYRNLARRLDPNQPIYGLQSQGLDGKQPLLTRIEDMAQLYVGEIQKLQPHGPYILGGYCMGGTLAFEAAHQLREHGERVALVAIMDTPNWATMPASTLRDDFYFGVEKIAFRWHRIWLKDFSANLKTVEGKIRALKNGNGTQKRESTIPVGRQPAGAHSTTASDDARSYSCSAPPPQLAARRAPRLVLGRERPAAEPRQSDLFARLWDANEQAAFAYAPRVYPGRLVQFRPAWQYARYRDAERSWEQLARGGVEVHELRVHPGEMLDEPFAAQLAAGLEQALDPAVRGAR